jgi:hypothetical protein
MLLCLMETLASIPTGRSFDVMPHIILAGVPDLAGFYQQFTQFRGDSNDWIIKIQQCFLSNTAQTLIFDCTAVRSGFSQDFYIRAEIKDGRVTVRVDPYMRIERNDGVQRCIVAIAKKLQDVCTGLTLSKTNLPESVIEQSGVRN